MDGLKSYLLGMVLWFDLGLSALAGGSPREYPSAAFYRKGVLQSKRRYLVMMWLVDFFFMKVRGQKEHCKEAFEGIRNREGMPKEYKQ